MEVKMVDGGPESRLQKRQHNRWQKPQQDYDTRRQMGAEIIRLVKNRKPDAPREYLQRLPDMARRLEDKLYGYAQSEAEYKDRATLKQWLKLIALELTGQRPPTDGGPLQPGRPPPPSSSGGGGSGLPPIGQQQMSRGGMDHVCYIGGSATPSCSSTKSNFFNTFVLFLFCSLILMVVFYLEFPMIQASINENV